MHIPTRTWTACSIAVLTLLAAAPAAGAAATASVVSNSSTGVPEYTDATGAGDAGTASTLVLSADDQNIVFDDTLPLTGGGNCVRDVADETIVRCPKSTLPGPSFPGGSVQIQLRGGGDTLTIEASTAPFFVVAEGGDGSDVFDEGARSGPHQLSGGQGSDRVDYRDRTQDLSITLNGGGPDGEEGEGSGIGGMETVQGGSGDDELRQMAAGRAELDGKGGDDTLGGIFHDVRMLGGAGFDTADLSDATGPITADADGTSASNLDDGVDADGNGDIDSNKSFAVGGDVESLVGGPSGDTLTASATTDFNRLTGAGGDDTLFGQGVNEVIDAGVGDDLVFAGGGNDSVTGGAGRDGMSGGTGSDTVSYQGHQTGVRVSFDGVQNDGTGNENDNIAAFENIAGGPGDDLLIGDENPNSISGFSGDDVIHDRGGTDLVSGGAGADHLVAGLGADLYAAGTSSDPAVDTLDYSARTQRVEVHADTNLFVLEDDDGEAGENDTVFPEIERIVGTPHADLLEGANSPEHGGGPENFLEGRGGNDTLVGNDGRDVLDGGDGADSLDGGAGRDAADYSDRADALTVDLDGNADDGEPGENDNALVEDVLGGEADDQLTGDGGANALAGGAGTDTIAALAGDDSLVGGPDPDTLDSGAGDDTVDAADGVADSIVCGGAGDALTADPIDSVDADCQPVPEPEEPPAPQDPATSTPPADQPATDPGPRPAPGPGPAVDTTPATVTRLAISPRRFRPAGSRSRRGGSTFRYTLSEDATVAIKIERLEVGVPAGRRCLKRRPGARGRKCTRAVRATTLTRVSKLGANSLRFAGRAGRRALRTGRYRATLVATDTGGRLSVPRSVRFTIVR